MDTINVQDEFKRLVADVYLISSDLGAVVEELIAEGQSHPLTTVEATQLLGTVVKRLKQRAERDGHDGLSRALSGDLDSVVSRVVVARTRIAGISPHKTFLISYNGIDPKAVEPTPRFHGRDVPMYRGYVMTNDIDLWEQNARLEIHVGQFRRVHGRGPSARELLSIMLSELRLPGMAAGDEFEIEDLARSIAANGVQKPPILDGDGTVLDGNRRIAGCYLILNSDEFSAEEKKRVQYIFVWQLSEFVTTEDRDAVVVALNFESDHKKTWPEYVRARKIYDEWQTMLGTWPMPPNERQQQQMRKELSKRFAVDPSGGIVNRYIKMVELANEFEDYHISQKGHDEFETKYRANEVFQYFDELAKGGARSGGVAWTLGQNDTLRHLTFDLLFDGKFKNWTLVRHLKHVNDTHLMDSLVKARNEPDIERAQELVEDTLTLARNRSVEARTVGINSRIEAFVELLEQMTVRTVRDEVKPELLMKLRDSLHLVDGLIVSVLEERSTTDA